jgi:hypothetical protein
VDKHEIRKINADEQKRLVNDTHKFVKTWLARADSLTRASEMNSADIAFEDYVFYLNSIKDEIEDVLNSTKYSINLLEILAQDSETKIKVSSYK